MSIRIRWNTSRRCWECVEGFAVVASFDKLHQAEAWVISECNRRESEAAS